MKMLLKIIKSLEINKNYILAIYIGELFQARRIWRKFKNVWKDKIN